MTRAEGLALQNLEILGHFGVTEPWGVGGFRAARRSTFQKDPSELRNPEPELRAYGCKTWPLASTQVWDVGCKGKGTYSSF